MSTPSREQFRADQLADRAVGYGMKGYTIDGNNILEVYHVVNALTQVVRNTKRPILLECNTFRMRGHEEASGTKYVPKELMNEWAEKDPISNFETFLLEEGVFKAEEILAIKKDLKKDINTAVDEAMEAAPIQVDLHKEQQQIYAPDETTHIEASEETDELRLVDAIKEGLQEGMRKHDNLILMGQDIAEYGGVFKITEGFVEEFGSERVRNTPLCESAILGASLGLSLKGKKSMVEMQFADFVSCGFNQIVNNLAKTHYRWGHAPQVVVRMPTGGGMGAGPFHSQSSEAWFTHVPGLKVVMPSNPQDGKGLLLSALDDPNPVLYFEHKGLYRSINGPVPKGYYHCPIGKARTVLEGEDLSIITYGMGVIWAEEVAKTVDASIEIIDLRSLVPWDEEAVYASVRKTGKCMVLYEATYTSGFGAEVAASIAENCFEHLDGPVARIASLDTPVPFHPDLEKQFMGKSRLEEGIQKLLEY